MATQVLREARDLIALLANGAISLIVAALIILGWLIFQPRTVLPSTLVEKSIPANERQFTTVTPEFLTGLFKKYNSAQAEELTKPYIGKWMRFSGKFSDVTRESETFLMSISPDPHTLETDYVVLASLSDQRWIKRALVMRPGEKVTVVGKIRRVVLPGVILENCEIEEQ